MKSLMKEILKRAPLEDSRELLLNLLQEASKTNELINTNGIRAIGKTSVLIEFAKKNGYGVIVYSKFIAQSFRERYEYNKIYSSDSILSTIDTKNIVIDEGVPTENFPGSSLKIITGYQRSKNLSIDDEIIISPTKQDNKNFYDEIVKGLKLEAQTLSLKLLNGNGIGGNNTQCASIRIMILKALRETLSLIKQYDWQLQYSEYTTDGIKQVATWEQNNEGEIKDHKIYNIRIPSVYVNICRYATGNHMSIFYNGKVDIFKNENSRNYASYIMNGFHDKNVNIYIDEDGLGVGLLDELSKLNAKNIYKLEY